MTTPSNTEVERVIDGEVVDDAAVTVVPVDERQADRIITRIELSVNTAATNLQKTFGYLDEAYRGDVWRTKGYQSWPAFVVEKLAPITEVMSKAQRRELVPHLSVDAHLSVRTIASVTNTPRETVRRLVKAGDSKVGHLESGSAPQTVGGADGKTYTRPTPVPEPQPEPEPEPRKARQAPWPRSAGRAIYGLERSAITVSNLFKDSARLARNRDAVSCEWNRLVAVRNQIDEAIFSGAAAVLDLDDDTRESFRASIAEMTDREDFSLATLRTLLEGPQ
ncbi:hypothetical protein [Williamsia sterculiae]|uniref:Uncharacterized protein n=1 Tax=Williamsia sterculiae TaxID=1344003 RepID=A0A1N7FE24_9NOCA|nr:hypothetical protein [Williamsia sterculiae]SIR98475.1 hypothetical protein SAMN05445060_1970 [Williamsia sterculiae]